MKTGKDEGPGKSRRPAFFFEKGKHEKHNRTNGIFNQTKQPCIKGGIGKGEKGRRNSAPASISIFFL
ncbi:MAG: hypothetical protein D6714_07025 [Bacteroidetes bacterium]|nr:MAG: hypothetical protein D6714_07025 [Bacteroidota bacterium]